MPGRRSNHTGHIRKRGDAWELRVSSGGRMHTRTVHGTRREADLALASMVLEFGRGYEQGSSSTVAQTVAQALALARLSPTTMAEYKRAITRLPVQLAEMPVWKVRPVDLERVYAQLARDGLGEHAIRRIHELLSSSFGRAVRWGWIDKNPAAAARPPARPRHQPYAATPVQVRDIIRAAPQPVDLWLRVAFVTGARRGEVCALQWNDLNVNRLVIRRNIVYTPDSGVVVKTTKTGNERYMSLDDGTVGALTLWHKVQTEAFDSQWVFTHNGFDPWRPDYVGLAIRRLQRKVGVKFKIHAMRHGAASELLDAGFPLSSVSERLGHDRETTTMNIYSHVLAGRDRQAADHLGGLLDADE